VGCANYTLYCGGGEQEEGRVNTLMGKPLDNCQLYVLDSKLRLLPVGVSGELYIGGAQLARGYQHLPELTSDKFITHAFEPGKEKRLYKSGDMARWLPDGNLEYLGRTDDQVKIRGYRVELGEIERVLRQAPGVREAVVMVRQDAAANKKLIGYIATEGWFDEEGIRQTLRDTLPEYMIPPILLEIPEIPLTANGKVDRKQLLAIDISSQLIKGYVAPENEVQEKLCAIWSELLGMETIGIYDDFFAIGGDSLTGIRMISHIAKAFSITIPIQAVFQFTTVSDLAKYLELQLLTGTTSEDEEAFEVMDI
jgi:acyl carrier protein